MMIIYTISCDNEGCVRKQEIEPVGQASPEYMAEAYGWTKKTGDNKHLCGPCQKKEDKIDDGKV
jgi:hypothetical protein